MVERIYCLFLLIIIALLLLHVVSSMQELCCSTMNEAFRKAAESHGQIVACHCYDGEIPISSNVSRDPKEMWIGCTSTSMPELHRALHIIEDVYVDKVRVWNARIPLIPGHMFEKVRARELIIESSALSVFREGVFKDIGPSLKSLSLRRNILKNLKPRSFTHLESLEELDLSFNKLEDLPEDIFDVIPNLERLIISYNLLFAIPAGLFRHQTALKVLNLAGNKLTRIEKDTFAGLNNLEFLYLNQNQIQEIHPEAFSHMKKLKVLDLGHNSLGAVDIGSLPSLESLFLNHNDIRTLNVVKVHNLSALRVYALDYNRIDKLLAEDFQSLKDSPGLDSLSLIANEIETVDPLAFQPVKQITKLSLQKNLLHSLVSSTGSESHPVEKPFLGGLSKLEALYLSENRLFRIGKDYFKLLKNLKVLTLDHNFIDKVHEEAFRDSPLERVYLSRNEFHEVPKGAISSLFRTLRIVDLSGNRLKCTCMEQWMGDWIHERIAPSKGGKHCIESPDCSRIYGLKKNKVPAKGTPVWANVVAVFLSFCITVVLIACILLIKSSIDRRELVIDKIPHILGKVPIAGYFVRRIGSLFSADKPATIDINTLYSPVFLSQKQPLISNLKPTKRSQCSDEEGPSIRMTPLEDSEKKRVRFTDTTSS